MRSLLVAVGVVVAAGAVRAESTVVVKNVHLCCGACVTGVNNALKTVDGVKGACDTKAKTVTITAADDAAAQKGIDALAAAGYHGDVAGTAFKVADDSGAATGKVKTLTVTGVHNCCGACNKAITAAVGKVAGVTGNTAKAKSDTFDVTGDFDPTELVKELNAAGFHVKVKK